MGPYSARLRVIMEFFLLLICGIALFRHREESGADFLNRTRSARWIRSHSRPLAKPRAQPFYFASGSASLRLSGFAAHRARVKIARGSRGKDFGKFGLPSCRDHHSRRSRPIKLGLCLTLARWARLVPSPRGTWSGTLFSASSRDYGILLLRICSIVRSGPSPGGRGWFRVCEEPGVGPYSARLRATMEFFLLLICGIALFRHREESGADFLNRTRSARWIRSHSRPLAKPRAQPFYFASGSASLRLSGFAALRARVKKSARIKREGFREIRIAVMSRSSFSSLAPY